MHIGLSEITTSTEPAEQVLAIICFAEKYGLIRELTAMVLAAGSDKPALQNLLLDDSMTLENGRQATQDVALDLVKLENRMERMFDRLDAKLDAAIVEMLHLRADAVRQPINLSGKAAAVIVIALAALVIGQISLLAWVGSLPHGG